MSFSDRDHRRLATLLRERALRRGEFRLASGKTSSVYLDVRRVSLTGEGAWLIGRGLWHLARHVDAHARAVGGLTLGADPLIVATAIAAFEDGATVAGIIVRKSAKRHGTMQFLEEPGDLHPGDRVIAVDDVITSGGSTVTAIQHLRQAGYVVEDALCVVDREAGGRDALACAGVGLHSLFTLSQLAEDL